VNLNKSAILQLYWIRDHRIRDCFELGRGERSTECRLILYYFITIDNGEGYVFVTYRSLACSSACASKVNALWSNFLGRYIMGLGRSEFREIRFWALLPTDKWPHVSEILTPPPTYAHTFWHGPTKFGSVAADVGEKFLGGRSTGTPTLRAAAEFLPLSVSKVCAVRFQY